MKLAYILNARMPTERAHGLQTMRMCEALIESGVDVTLIVPRRKQSNPALRSLDPFEFYGLSKPFPIRRVPHLDLLPLEPLVGRRLLRPFFIPANLAFALSSALAARSLRPGLCFTREWMAAWLLVRMGIPTIYESHMVDDMSFSKRAWRAIRSAARSPNLVRIVTVTRAIKDDLVTGGVPEDKIIVLSAGVDIRRYPPQELPRQPGENALVLYTGSLYESKGVYVLAQAAANLQGAQVLLQGGPPEEYERLSRFVSEHGLGSVIVRQHMPPSEIPALQQSADILAYTPTGEDIEQERYTSPIKLYEYMATGRPIISSDLPSIREVLCHEETALLVRPNDPAAVADAVNRLLSDPELAQRLARNARLKVEEFTWQNRVRRLLDAVNPDYPSILEEASPFSPDGRCCDGIAEATLHNK